MFGKRKKGGDAPEPEQSPALENPDASTGFGSFDPDDIASQFGQEAEGVWDGMEDSPLTGAVGATLSPIPDDLLHSGRVKAVRFQIASPSGYYFPQVEEFVRQVGEALEGWESLVHERDVYIHSLQRELELQRRDVRSLRTQIEIFRVQGDAVVNSDGSYLTESQLASSPTQNVIESTANDEELTYFRERTASLEVAIDQTNAILVETEAQLSAALAEIDALRAAPPLAAAPAPAADAGLPPEYEENLAAWQNAVTERDRVIIDLQNEIARLTQSLATRPPMASPAPQAAPQAAPLPPQPQPPRPPQQPYVAPVAGGPEVPLSWTPAAPQPAQAPDPRLASPGRVNYEEESPLSVWAPDLINAPIDMAADDDLRGSGDEFPDTSFRNR